MMRRTLSIALMLALSTAAATAAQTYYRSTQAPGARPALPPLIEAEPGQEGADQLWRQAREELNRQNYRRAAELYERFIDRYASHSNAPDAYYWQAFALHKLNGDDDLEDAKRLLERQRARYPRAATREQADALLVRIRGDLAQRGDADDAAIVTREASRVATQETCAGRADDSDVREAALNSLMHMDPASAVPILKRIMSRKHPSCAMLRRRAVFQISQQRSGEREEILLDAARNDPDREVREQAVFWLSQVPSEKAFDAIVEILNNSTDRQVQEKAIHALSQHRSQRAAQALRAWAESSNRPRDLRKNAIFWIGQRAGPENARYLRELYPKIDDEELRKQIIFAVSQRRDAGTDSWLMDIALDEKEEIEVRKQALFWAGQNRAVNIAQVGALYDRMNHREMKNQIIFVLSQRRDRAAIDKLIDIAKNEKNTELRKQAIFWLGQSKDPRAVQFLAELIER